MVRALGHFSDACVPAELNSDCPFYETNADGPVCGEQCKDILASIGGDRPASGGLVLIDGFELHRRRPRPRPRRGPDRRTRPFDAREGYLGDRDRPRDVRSAASLIHELQVLLFEHPALAPDPLEREYEIRASFDELARRGVDVEAIVRYGLQDQIVLGIAMLATLPEFGIKMDGELPHVGKEWHELMLASYAVDKRRHVDRMIDYDALMRRMRNVAASLDVLPPLNAPGTASSTERSGDDAILITYALAGRFITRLISWVQTADINEVLTWQAPEARRFVNEPVQIGPSPAAVEHGRWLFDRFSKTYLADWDESSLRHEWRYLLARCPGAAPAEVMRERQTRAEEVSACLADLSSTPTTSPPGVPSDTADTVALYKFVHLAAKSLNEGRRQEAIALYRGLAQLRPDDPDITNNYGFCLLVDDPESATQWLERAAALREGRIDSTNVANRVYAAVLLGDHERAVELAEGLYEASQTATFQHAYLWVAGTDGPELGEEVDPVHYVAKLAVTAAEALDRSDLVKLWQDRAIETSGD